MKTLEKTYTDTLVTAAQNQTNVSEFLPEYDNVIGRVNAMFGTGNVANEPIISNGVNLADFESGAKRQVGTTQRATSTPISNLGTGYKPLDLSVFER